MYDGGWFESDSNPQNVVMNNKKIGQIWGWWKMLGNCRYWKISQRFSLVLLVMCNKFNNDLSVTSLLKNQITYRKERGQGHGIEYSNSVLDRLPHPLSHNPQILLKFLSLAVPITTICRLQDLAALKVSEKKLIDKYQTNLVPWLILEEP